MSASTKSDPRFAQIAELVAQYDRPTTDPAYSGKSNNERGAMRAAISRQINALQSALLEVADMNDDGTFSVDGNPLTLWTAPKTASTKTNDEMRVENSKSDQDLIDTLENLTRKFSAQGIPESVRENLHKRIENVAKVARTRVSLTVEKTGDTYTVTVA